MRFVKPGRLKTLSSSVQFVSWWGLKVETVRLCVYWGWPLNKGWACFNGPCETTWGLCWSSLFKVKLLMLNAEMKRSRTGYLNGFLTLNSHFYPHRFEWSTTLTSSCASATTRSSTTSASAPGSSGSTRWTIRNPGTRTWRCCSPRGPSSWGTDLCKVCGKFFVCSLCCTDIRHLFYSSSCWKRIWIGHETVSVYRKGHICGHVLKIMEQLLSCVYEEKEVKTQNECSKYFSFQPLLLRNDHPTRAKIKFLNNCF